MSIIKDLQVSLLLQEAIHTAQSKASTLDLTRLRAIIDNMSSSDILGTPMFANSKLTKMQNVDYMNTHNVNIKSLVMDYKTMAGTINWLFASMDQLNSYTDTMKSFFSTVAAKLENQLLSMRRKLEIGGKSIVIDFKDKSSIDASSNADIDYVNGKANLYRLATSDRTFKYKPGTDVNPSIVFGSNFVDTPGTMNSLFDPAFTGTTTFNVRSTSSTAVAGTFTFRLDIDDEAPTLNSITINSQNKVPTKIKPIIVVDQVEVPLDQDLIVGGTVTYTFQPAKISAIKLELSQSLYDRVENGDYIYQFKFGNILMENTLVSNTSTILSTALEAGMPVSIAKMRTVDKAPLGTTISYSVSTDGLSWSKIVPVNYGENSFNSVSVGSQKDVQITPIDTSLQAWSDLTPQTSYGNSTLYNILENAPSGSFTDGQTLTLASGESIDAENIQIYRGLDNYAIDIKTVQVSANTENTLYMFQAVNGYFNAESIYVNVTNEPQVVKYNMRIKTRYLANKTILVKIVDALGKEVDIIRQENYELLLRDRTRGETVYVTYTTTINEIQTVDNVSITIDDQSFEVRSIPTGPDKGGSTLVFDATNNYLTVAPNNDYNPASTGDGTYHLYVSFKYIIESTQPIKVYSTNVKYDVQQDIKVYPFSQEEIRAGNLHMIDGQSVSSLNAFTMTKGWHEILTTQPYMTDPYNPKDTNSLTSKPSKAGFDLGTYSEMLAFKGKLKNVSIKNLANRIRKGDHRSFAYHDGKILVNFQPEELPQFFESEASHLTGDELLCKKVVYDQDKFMAYVRVDESFQLFYNIIDETNSSSQIYVKAEMSKDPNTAAKPSINRIELILL